MEHTANVLSGKPFRGFESLPLRRFIGTWGLLISDDLECYTLFMDVQNALSGMLPPEFGPILVVLLVWSVAWKGLALWHSARRTDYIWFIIFLFVNTIGILEIVYLFVFAKKRFNNLFSK